MSENQSCSSMLGAALALLIAGAACAREAERPPAYPKTGDPVCSYVGLEASSAPAHDTLDATSLVAVYRLQEPHAPAPKQPIELKFLVQRSREDELRGLLEAQPEVICRPDHDAHYHVEVSGLDGFSVER
jgi:hypothetical protein